MKKPGSAEARLEASPPAFRAKGRATVDKASVITGASLPECKQTGLYRDDRGNQFFWRQGDKMPPGLKLVEAADRSKGAPERRGGGEKAEKAD